MKWFPFLILITIFQTYGQCPEYKGDDKRLKKIPKQSCVNPFLGDDNTIVYTDPSIDSLQKICFRLANNTFPSITTPYRVIYNIQSKTKLNDEKNHFVFGETVNGMNVSKIVQKKDTVYIEGITFFLKDGCQFEVNTMAFDENGLLVYKECESNDPSKCTSFRVISEDRENIAFDNTSINRILASDPESKLIVLNNSFVHEYDPVSKALALKPTFSNGKIQSFNNSICVVEETTGFNYYKYDKTQIVGSQFIKLSFVKTLTAASSFKDGFAFIKDETSYSIIDADGNDQKILGKTKFDSIGRLPNSSLYIIANSKNCFFLYNPITSKAFFLAPDKPDKFRKVKLLFENDSLAHFWIESDKQQLLVYTYKPQRFRLINILPSENVKYIFQSMQEGYFLYTMKNPPENAISNLNYFRITSNSKVDFGNPQKEFEVSYPIIKNFAIDKNKIIDAADFFKP